MYASGRHSGFWAAVTGSEFASLRALLSVSGLRCKSCLLHRPFGGVCIATASPSKSPLSPHSPPRHAPPLSAISSRSVKVGQDGGTANRGADCRVQGGVQPVRQGWRWFHHDEGARHCDEVAGTESYRGGASGYDQRGRCRRQRHHRLRGVLEPDGPQDEGHGLRGGVEGGVPRVRQGSERFYLGSRAEACDDEPGGEAYRR